MSKEILVYTKNDLKVPWLSTRRVATCCQGTLTSALALYVALFVRVSVVNFNERITLHT